MECIELIAGTEGEIVKVNGAKISVVVEWNFATSDNHTFKVEGIVRIFRSPLNLSRVLVISNS